MNEKAYKVLKWVAAIVLPAAGTLYATLGGIWNLPYVEQIPATILAVDTFLGAVMMLNDTKTEAKNAGNNK